MPPLPPAVECCGESRPEPVHYARRACIERSSRHLGPACIHAPNFALHFAGGRPARNRPDEGNTMSNGHGVTATLGNAAESFADRAKEIGRAVTKRASKAVSSDEHTSELQSLMRISYAVFCLKK